MQIAFIRHAQAVDAADFDGADADRPLTAKGWKSARKAFLRLPHVLEPPFLLLHSPARRARETAAALAEAYPRVRKEEAKALQPGASPGTIRRILKEHARRHGCLVLVGHEPDFSRAVADLTGGRCRLRKGAVAVVGTGEAYRLEALLEPEHLQAMKKAEAG
jgi:phosphohistidine phosphatase